MVLDDILVGLGLVYYCGWGHAAGYNEVFGPGTMARHSGQQQLYTWQLVTACDSSWGHMLGMACIGGWGPKLGMVWWFSLAWSVAQGMVLAMHLEAGQGTYVALTKLAQSLGPKLSSLE